MYQQVLADAPYPRRTISKCHSAILLTLPRAIVSQIDELRIYQQLPVNMPISPLRAHIFSTNADSEQRYIGRSGLNVR